MSIYGIINTFKNNNARKKYIYIIVFLVARTLLKSKPLNIFVVSPLAPKKGSTQDQPGNNPTVHKEVEGSYYI